MTFCAYCGRKHAPELTQCEGCGAPVTTRTHERIEVTSFRSGYLTIDGVSTAAHVCALRTAWEAPPPPPAATNPGRQVR